MNFHLQSNMILFAHKLTLWLHITNTLKQMLLEQIKPSNQTLSGKDTSFFSTIPRCSTSVTTLSVLFIPPRVV